jgi:hypothetical protein
MTNHRDRHFARLRANALAALGVVGDAYVAAGEAYDADPTPGNADAEKVAADALREAQREYDRQFRPANRWRL